MGRALFFMSIGLFVIFGMLQVSQWGRMEVLADRNNSYAKEAQALSIASSVMDMAIQELRRDYTWRNGVYYNNYLGGEAQVTVYDVNSTNLPAGVSVTSLDGYSILLISSGTFEQEEREIEVLLTLPSFSKYAYFTETELMSNGRQIYFYDNDQLNGPVHTNGTFYIAGSPVFNGEVTSVNDWKGYGSNGSRREEDQPVFNDGFIVLDSPVDLPEKKELGLLRNEGISGGLAYNTEIELQFTDDGSVSVYERLSEDNLSLIEKRDITTFNGVISSTDKIYMRGVVDGMVTVHSEDDIEIIGDLIYKDNPSEVTSDDILGIVGEKNIIVDENAHRSEGSDDLHINASIMALGESFYVEDYSSGSYRGDLHVLGGIIQERRGAVGTFGSRLTGYSKDYNYDERLKKIYPPYFPRASRFDIVYWKE